MKRSAEAMRGRDWRSASGDQSDRHRDSHSPKRMRSANDALGRKRNECKAVKTLADEKETDPRRLAQRQKQIDYGKNTIGYDRYCAQVPRHERRRGKQHPMTPDKTMRVGKKVFDGFVRKWRQALHTYDPPELAEATAATGRARAMAGGGDTGSAGDSGAAEATAAAVVAMAACASPPSAAGNTTRTGDERSTTFRRSIYENFDDDTFEAKGNSDDDLL